MIRNNMKVDIRTKMLEEGMNTIDLAKEMKVSGNCTSHLSRGLGVVNKNFVRMMEILGYDIQISYEKIRP